MDQNVYGLGTNCSGRLRLLQAVLQLGREKKSGARGTLIAESGGEIEQLDFRLAHKSTARTEDVTCPDESSRGREGGTERREVTAKITKT